MKPVFYIAASYPKLSETFVYREVEALRREGIDVRVVSVRDPDEAEREAVPGGIGDGVIRLYGPGLGPLLRDGLLEGLRHPLRAARSFGRFLPMLLGGDGVAGCGARGKLMIQFLGSLALVRRIRAANPSYLHAHMAHVPTTFAMFTSWQLGVPFGFTGHAADLFRDRILLKEKIARALQVNCISEWHREFYQGIVDRSSKDFPVVRCGVDPAAFSYEPRHRDSPPYRLLAVGRLVPKKGFDLLLEAVALLRERGCDCRVGLVGGGPEAESLARLVERFHLSDAVVLYGPLANDVIATMMGEHDLFVLPCRISDSRDRDGIPVVLMEAMARGLPVVTSALPTILELVKDGETGYLCNPGDLPGLVETTFRALHDADGRAMAAHRARARIEDEFALAINARRMISHLCDNGVINQCS